MEELVLFGISPSADVVRVIRFTNQWMQLYSNVIFVFYKTDYSMEILQKYTLKWWCDGESSRILIRIYSPNIPTYQFDTSDLGVFIHRRIYGPYTVKLRWQTDLSVFLIILEIFLKSLDLSKGSITKMNIGAILMFLFQKYVWKSGVKALYN